MDPLYFTLRGMRILMFQLPGFYCNFLLVAEFISQKCAHFQFHQESYYPKKCKVYSFSHSVLKTLNPKPYALNPNPSMSHDP